MKCLEDAPKPIRPGGTVCLLGSSPEEQHYAYLTPRLMTRFEVGIKRETFSFIVVSM
jgi:hypothetical protein